MSRCIKRCIAIGAILVWLPGALAYIDPGTGGLVVGSWWIYLIGLFGAIGAFITLRFIRPLIARIKKFIRRREDEKS